jgi:hypothetical protein
MSDGCEAGATCASRQEVRSVWKNETIPFMSAKIEGSSQVCQSATFRVDFGGRGTSASGISAVKAIRKHF